MISSRVWISARNFIHARRWLSTSSILGLLCVLFCLPQTPLHSEPHLLDVLTQTTLSKKSMGPAGKCLPPHSPFFLPIAIVHLLYVHFNLLIYFIPSFVAYFLPFHYVDLKGAGVLFLLICTTPPALLNPGIRQALSKYFLNKETLFSPLCSWFHFCI